MTVFADTSFYVALLNRKDAHHLEAIDWATMQRPTVVTTEFVLLEVANFFTPPKDRGSFTSLVHAIRSDSATTIIPCDTTWFQKGLNRFARVPIRNGRSPTAFPSSSWRITV